MAGIGAFISKNVLDRYAVVLDEDCALSLIDRLRAIRRKQSSALSEKDIPDILRVDAHNSQILFSKINSAVFKRRKIPFQCRLVLVSENGQIHRADISWTDASWRNIALFLKARLGPRLLER
jgi:tRNA A-37 threonylcarbamoyl transferase component Bud32